MLEVVQTLAVLPGLRLCLILEVALLDALLATTAPRSTRLCRVARLIRWDRGLLAATVDGVWGDEDVGGLAGGRLACKQVSEKQLVGTAMLAALGLFIVAIVIVALMMVMMLTTVHHSLATAAVLVSAGAVVKCRISCRMILVLGQESCCPGMVMVYELWDLVAVPSGHHCGTAALVMGHVWLGGCRGGCRGGRVNYYLVVTWLLDHDWCAGGDDGRGGDGPPTPTANRGKDHLMVLHRGIV